MFNDIKNALSNSLNGIKSRVAGVLQPAESAASRYLQQAISAPSQNLGNTLNSINALRQRANEYTMANIKSSVQNNPIANMISQKLTQAGGAIGNGLKISLDELNSLKSQMPSIQYHPENLSRLNEVPGLMANQFKSDFAPAGQYIKDTAQGALDTAISAGKTTDPYKLYRYASGNPVSPGEQLGNILDTATGLLNTAWRINPYAPAFGAGSQLVGDIRRGSQGQNVDLTQSMMKGLNAQPGLGQIFTDDPKSQAIIDTAFMAAMFIAPVASKKFGEFSIKYKGLNESADTLGVNANTSMAEVSTKWKAQVIKYQDAFAGRGTPEENAIVVKLNNAYNSLKQAGVIDKNFAAFFDSVSLGLSTKEVSLAEHNRMYVDPKRLSVSAPERSDINNLVNTAITKSTNQTNAIERLGIIVDKAIQADTPNKLQQLKTLRASISRNMFDVVGGSGTGNYKQDYAVFQRARQNPDLSQLVDNMEAQVLRIDDSIKELSVNIPKKPTLTTPTIDRTQLTGRQLSMTNEQLLHPERIKPNEDLGVANREWQQNKPESQTPLDQIRKTSSQLDNFDSYMKSSATPIKNKVNILDKMRTPDRVLQKIGLGKEAAEIRTAWNSYLDNLPKEIDRITAWSKEAPGASSNQQIFKFLDGQISDKNLLPNELKVANEVKSYLKSWADKLGLPQDKRISSYITHIWERGSVASEFPEDIAALIRDKVPGSVYDPFVLKRLGSRGYKEDVWASLDAYTKRALRKTSLDPVLEKISAASTSLEDSQFRYIKQYIDNVNMRPANVDIDTDNFIKSTFGYMLGPRPVTTVARNARQWIYRGLLGLNPVTALKNLSQGANTYSVLGEKYTAVGYAKVVQNMPAFLTGKDTELNAVGVLRDGFVQDRQLASTKQALQTMDKGLFYMFNLSEKINRGAAYFGAKAKYLKQGLPEKEAIAKAIEVVRDTQFTFGAIDTPVALQSDLMKTMFQFQNFGVKQIEFLGEKVQKRDWVGLVRYTAASLLFITTVGKSLGMDWKDMIPSVKFGTVPPSLQLPYEAGKAVLGTPDKYGNVPTTQERLQNVGGAAMNYVPAGGQIKRTYQGANFVNQGGSYTSAGNLQYPFTGNPVSAAVFGKYNNEAAQNYFNNPQPLSEKQTDMYKSLIQSGATPQEAYAMETASRNNGAQLKDVLKQQSGTGENLIQKLFGGSKASTPTAPVSQDPLFAAVQSEAQTTQENANIKEIFQTARNQKEAETMMKAMGITKSYEDASIQMIQAMPDPKEADYLWTELNAVPPQDQPNALNNYIDKKVITDAIVKLWLDTGKISDAEATALKNQIKVKTGGKITRKKPAKLALGSIKKPTYKKIVLKPMTFKPLKIKKVKLTGGVK